MILKMFGITSDLMVSVHSTSSVIQSVGGNGDGCIEPTSSFALPHVSNTHAVSRRCDSLHPSITTHGAQKSGGGLPKTENGQILNAPRTLRMILSDLLV